ncbi:MAG: YdeI/OmpD-associated family protein [Flavobacteriales bacterium]
MSKKEPQQFCPESLEQWRQWLQENHKIAAAVWLIQYKKGSSKPVIPWSDAVDEALCFGWIDSIRRPMDEECFQQYFSPRKPQSIWSKINKDKVERLAAEGRMTEAGLECIRVAKENGSWSFFDDVENLVVPQDLEAALAKQDAANAFFQAQSKSTKKRMLAWVVMAKRPETREKRVMIIVKNATKQQVPKELS